VLSLVAFPCSQALYRTFSFPISLGYSGRVHRVLYEICLYLSCKSLACFVVSPSEFILFIPTAVFGLRIVESFPSFTDAVVASFSIILLFCLEHHWVILCVLFPGSLLPGRNIFSQLSSYIIRSFLLFSKSLKTIIERIVLCSN